MLGLGLFNNLNELKHKKIKIKSFNNLTAGGNKTLLQESAHMIHAGIVNGFKLGLT